MNDYKGLTIPPIKNTTIDHYNIATKINELLQIDEPIADRNVTDTDREEARQWCIMAADVVNTETADCLFAEPYIIRFKEWSKGTVRVKTWTRSAIANGKRLIKAETKARNHAANKINRSSKID